MNNNRTWEALSMKDRASFIKLAIQNGYRNLDSIRDVYNSSNKFDTGGDKSERPITDKERAEYIIRSSEGVNGKINLRNARALNNMYKAYNTDTVNESFDPSNSSSLFFDNLTYTGSLIQPDLNDISTYYTKVSELPEGTVDFVDAYINNETPMTNLGVVKKQQGKGEKRILRSAIKSYPNINVYQTHPDTLDVNTVNYLDSQLAKGLPKNGDKLTTHNVSMHPEIFRIGDSNIVYDGNYATVVGVKTPEGKYAYKSIDLFDFNPDNWNYRVSKKGKEVLKYLNENGNPYIMSSPWYYKPEWDWEVPLLWSKGGKMNKFDTGGPTKGYNAIMYNGDITAPIEEISITGNSRLTRYKPGTKDYINQIRKFTDRIYSGDLAIDAVPEYYRKGVQNTLRGDQFANKVRQSRDEDYRVLRNAMTAIPLAVGAQAVLPAIPVDKVIKAADKVSDLYTKWVPKSVRRGVKSAWEGFSLYDTIDNLDDRIETANNAFQDGKIGKGLFNTSLTLLDLAGIGSSINDIKKLGKKFVGKLPEFNGIDLEHPSVPAFIRNSNKAPIINYKVNTFLNSPSKITTYFLNKKFPQKQREEVWQRVVDYNNMQRRRAGLDDMSIPYNENVIKAANRLDEIKNIFGKIDVNGDLGKVLAHSKGKITDANYDVRFFLPSLFQKDKYFSPRAIGAHEVRHGIQHTFGTKNVGFGRAEQKVLSDLNDYDLEYGLSFSDLLGGSSTKREQKILENSKYRKNRTNWVKSLPEFDAEMSTFREVYQLDDSYDRWDSKHRYLFNKWASERFGISYEEAMDIAEGLSTKGYALGGPLYNQNNPIESFKGNPYIPVVRY